MYSTFLSFILTLQCLRIVIASHGNETVNEISTTVRNVLSLKNNNYPIGDTNITVKSELKRPLIINVDSEPIFLPLNPNNYHPDKVLERLQLDNGKNSQSNTNDNSLLNFSAYVVKPLKFDYAKVFAQARANAQNQDFGQSFSFTTLPPPKFNGYNTGQLPHFEGLHYQPQFKSKYFVT